VPRAPRGHDRDVLEGVGPTAALGSPDLDLVHLVSLSGGTLLTAVGMRCRRQHPGRRRARCTALGMRCSSTRPPPSSLASQGQEAHTVSALPTEPTGPGPAPVRGMVAAPPRRSSAALPFSRTRFGALVSSPAPAGAAQLDYPDKIDGAVLKVAAVVVLGAIMSILDITVVNVALPTFQSAFAEGGQPLPHSPV